MSKCSVKEAVSKIKSVLDTKGLSDAGKKMAESRVNAIAAVLVEMQKFKNEHALGRENQESVIEQAKENAKAEEAKSSTPTEVKKGKTGFKLTPRDGASGKWTPKDQLKANIANAFIGRPKEEGKQTSSTAMYLANAKEQDIPTNQNIHATKDTIAFVSVNGGSRASKMNNDATVGWIQNVLNAGGTVLVDTEHHATKAANGYNNKGEGAVQAKIKELYGAELVREDVYETAKINGKDTKVGYSKLSLKTAIDSPTPIIGDIWEQDGYKVITTNLGGVHGRGLAKQAKDKSKIKTSNKDFDSRPDNDVITLAVKGKAPETAKIKGRAYSEKVEGGNLGLLSSELDKLVKFAKTTDKNIYLPLAGLGFGEGDPAKILPLLKQAAKQPNIILIEKDAKTVSKYKESFKPGVRSDKTGVGGASKDTTGLENVDTSRVGEHATKPWRLNGSVWTMRVSKSQAQYMKNGMNEVENFGNPFTVDDKLNENAMDFTVGGNGKATVAYYEWLKSNKKPEGYNGNEKLLDKRRKWILDNLDMVRNATKLHYAGTAKDQKVSHVNALIKIAEDTAKKPKKVQDSKFNPEKTLEEQVKEVATKYNVVEKDLLELAKERPNENLEDLVLEVTIDNTPPWEDEGTATTTESKKPNKTVEVKSMEEFIEVMKEEAKEHPEAIKYYEELLRDLDKAGFEFRPIRVNLVDVVVDEQGFDKPIAGMYDNDIITLARNVQGRFNPAATLVHEYAHAITVKGLAASKALNDKVTALRTRAETALRGHKHWSKVEYAFRDSSNAEFVAEIVANPYLQAMLDKMEGKPTLVNQIKKIFNKILNTFKGDKTALVEGLEIVQELRKVNEIEAKSNESYDKMAGYMDISPTEMTLNKEC
jgi:hypothetical protein